MHTTTETLKPYREIRQLLAKIIAYFPTLLQLDESQVSSGSKVCVATVNVSEGSPSPLRRDQNVLCGICYPLRAIKNSQAVLYDYFSTVPAYCSTPRSSIQLLTSRIDG